MVSLPPQACPVPRRPRRGGQVDNGVLVGGLIVLILLAIGVGVFLIRHPGDDSARMQRATRPMDFQCERCGHKFSMAPTDFHKQWLDVDPSTLPEGSRYKAHCPRCKERYCAKILDDRLDGEARRQPQRPATKDPEGKP